MKIKHWGYLAVVMGAFAAGAKAGVEYAKNNYVSKDRKFIEAEISKREKQS